MPAPPKVVNIRVIESNMELTRLVGSYIAYWERLNSKGDADLARLVGCSRQGIWNIRKGLTKYCSITYLSCISLAFGLTLIELIDEARRVEAEGL